MRYRRARVNGGAYFLTVNLAERHQSLLVEYIDVLRKVVGMVKERHPFSIDAMVILPEHLHAVWTLPPGDADYPRRWVLIQAGLSRHIPQGERRSASGASKGERGIWQRRYWEYLIQDESGFARHMDWPYSSIHRCIEAGMIDRDWGAGICENDKRAMVKENDVVGGLLLTPTCALELVSV